MAQARRKALDLQGFLIACRQWLANGATDFADAAMKATAKHTLDPALESEALRRGLADIAREALGSHTREHAIRSVRVTTATSGGGTRTVSVSVIPSELRTWPIITVSGAKPLEACTVEEAETQVLHYDRTIRGLERRRVVIAAAAKAAASAGLELIGELDDETLNECLALAQEG